MSDVCIECTLHESYNVRQEAPCGVEDSLRTVHLLTCPFKDACTTIVTKMKNSELMVAPGTVQIFLRAESAPSKPNVSLSG